MMDYRSASGNVATVSEDARGDKVFLSICWDRKPSQEDVDEFNAWFMENNPNCRLAGTEINKLSDQPAVRKKFFEGR